MANRMRALSLFCSGLINEKSRVLVLAQKSIWTIIDTEDAHVAKHKFMSA
jgi:hypothetical protein